MSRERPTVAEDWDGFSKMVIPDDAPPDQYREMRRAFYAGVWSALANFMNGLDTSQPITPARLEYIESIKQEGLDFLAEMVKEEGIDFGCVFEAISQKDPS